MTNLEQGIVAFDKSDFHEAFQILLPLAKTGVREAQKIISGMYLVGNGVERNFTEAAKWCRMAAEQGDPISQFNLVSFIMHDNPEEALQWLIVSAEQDFSFAAANLGDIYSAYSHFFSEPEKYRNDTEALKWYRKAASLGIAHACHRLGDIFLSGQGVAKDKEQAFQWYLSAANMNHEPSQELLGKAYDQGLLGLPVDPERAKYWLAKAETNRELVRRFS
jgi:uncharacterized protein